jgi:hypothetical protein
MNGSMNESAKRKKKLLAGGELGGEGEGVVRSKGSFKCKTAGKWSLYYTLAIKDDPGSSEGVNKDHKAQINSPTPQDKSVTTVGKPAHKKVAHCLLFIACGGLKYSVFVN